MELIQSFTRPTVTDSSWKYCEWKAEEKGGYEPIGHKHQDSTRSVTSENTTCDVLSGGKTWLWQCGWPHYLLAKEQQGRPPLKPGEAQPWWALEWAAALPMSRLYLAPPGTELPSSSVDLCSKIESLSLHHTESCKCRGMNWMECSSSGLSSSQVQWEHYLQITWGHRGPWGHREYGSFTKIIRKSESGLKTY